VQRLRAQSCAIITGADSVIVDNARMNVRWSELGESNKSYPVETLRQPLRVVIDSQCRLTPELVLFKQISPVLIIRADEKNKTDGKLENLPGWPHFVQVVTLPRIKNYAGNFKIDLNQLVIFLAEQGLNDILIEAGAKLCGAFVEQNLVDEFILYQAPKLIGGDGKNLLEMPGLNKLKQAKVLSISDIRMVGEDIRITSQFTNIK
jgi:diaminohydroxyphosphoribosylaminopyrimidine deaminase/5-amino-6-(5-phosphoribosylamino)uracil reductase